MSYQLSQKSLDKLKGVDERLVKVVNSVSPVQFELPDKGGES